MGLDTSHDCWHGPYSSFNNWRRDICEVAGYGKLDDYEGFGGLKKWPDGDPLSELLYHSDCDGIIPVKSCLPIAKRLKQLIPAMKVKGEYSRVKTQDFIDGLMCAHKRKEDVDFH